MQITTPAGNTTVDIFPVIPEIYQENWFSLARLTHTVVHMFPMFRTGKQTKISVFPKWNISKVPAKITSSFNHLIKIFRFPHDIPVLAMIAGRKAKRNSSRFQNFHCRNQLLVTALASSEIGCFFITFNA